MVRPQRLSPQRSSLCSCWAFSPRPCGRQQHGATTALHAELVEHPADHDCQRLDQRPRRHWISRSGSDLGHRGRSPDRARRVNRRKRCSCPPRSDEPVDHQWRCWRIRDYGSGGGHSGIGHVRSAIPPVPPQHDGFPNVAISYDLRDIDASGDNAIQQVALQYRVGSSGTSRMSLPDTSPMRRRRCRNVGHSGARQAARRGRRPAACPDQGHHRECGQQRRMGRDRQHPRDRRGPVRRGNRSGR